MFLPLLLGNSEPVPVEPIALVDAGGSGDPNGTGTERGKETPPEENVGTDDVNRRLAARSGNLRETLFDLYDWYERHRRTGKDNLALPAAYRLPPCE